VVCIVQNRQKSALGILIFPKDYTQCGLNIKFHEYLQQINSQPREKFELETKNAQAQREKEQPSCAGKERETNLI
jgi:hypothetical protein